MATVFLEGTMRDEADGMGGARGPFLRYFDRPDGFALMATVFLEGTMRDEAEGMEACRGRHQKRALYLGLDNRRRSVYAGFAYDPRCWGSMRSDR